MNEKRQVYIFRPQLGDFDGDICIFPMDNLDCKGKIEEFAKKLKEKDSKKSSEVSKRSDEKQVDEAKNKTNKHKSSETKNEKYKEKALEKDESEADEDEFVAEKVVDKRTKKGKVEYLIKWKDYGESDNTWEPSDQKLIQELVAKYEKKVKNDSDEEEFIVERILDKRVNKRGKTEYFCK